MTITSTPAGRGALSILATLALALPAMGRPQSVDRSLDLADHRAASGLAPGSRVTVDQVALSGGRSVELRLERFEVLAPDARIVVGSAKGDRVIARPDVVLLRGGVVGDGTSRAFIAISSSGVQGFIETGGALDFHLDGSRPRRTAHDERARRRSGHRPASVRGSRRRRRHAAGRCRRRYCRGAAVSCRPHRGRDRLPVQRQRLRWRHECRRRVRNHAHRRGQRDLHDEHQRSLPDQLPQAVGEQRRSVHRTMVRCTRSSAAIGTRT